MVANAKKRKTTGRYAESTKVTPEKTLMDIRRVLDKYGSTEFAFAESDGQVGIMFKMKDRRVRLLLPLPIAMPPATVAMPVVRPTRTCSRLMSISHVCANNRFAPRPTNGSLAPR